MSVYDCESIISLAEKISTDVRINRKDMVKTNFMIMIALSVWLMLATSTVVYCEFSWTHKELYQSAFTFIIFIVLLYLASINLKRKRIMRCKINEDLSFLQQLLTLSESVDHLLANNECSKVQSTIYKMRLKRISFA